MEDINLLLSTFETKLDRALADSWKERETPALLASLVEGAEAVGEAAIEVGHTCWERFEAGEKASLPFYVIHFLWTGRVKSFLILWRDVVFELQKAYILLKSGSLPLEQFDQLREESRQVLEEAATELKAYPEKEIQAARRGRGGVAQQVKRWRRIANPWPTYREQIAFLPAQCRCLLDEHLELKKTGGIVSAIEERIEQAMSACEKELEDLETMAKNTIQFIEEQLEADVGPKLGKIATRLEDLDAEIELNNYLADFSSALEEKIEALPEKMQVSICIDAGLVQYKEINFRRSMRQWLESETLPVLYEIWEIAVEVRQSLRMSLVNIRNRSLLLATEMRDGRTPDVERADLCQPLTAFLKKDHDYQENLAELRELIEQRLRKEFSLPIVYDLYRDFLPIPLQSTINQLGFSRNVALRWGQQWLSELTGRLQQFKTSVEREEALSVSEKIVRFIRGRSFPPENHHYTSIFITKGYIGESFWVGREQDLAHMSGLIANWRRGFRGAVALTGRRFCGKSLFGELAANRYFPKNTIRLAPERTVWVEGRHITAGYDLGEVLDFIRKHSLNIRPLVWIDDLELWQDPDHPLGENVRLLSRSIDNYAGRIFFMVSMSNWLKTHLDKFHGIDKVFQAEINLDRMPLRDIREAILIRHGATHKLLVDDKGREVTPQQFRKMTDRIGKAANGNIGEALNWWSSHTRKVNEEEVRHDFSAGYSLPDFINPDIALILASVMLKKRTNEYRLRKLFGPAFGDKYGSIVQRLISLGLLNRHADGWLEVNELVVNELGSILESRRYLPVQENE